MSRQPDVEASSGEKESTILLVGHHVSSPGSPNPVLKQITGTQESTLSFPQAYIPHAIAGWYCVNRNVPEWRTSLTDYTITSTHVPVFRSPKSSCVPMQNLGSAGLCFTLEQNTRELAQDGQQAEGF